MSNYEWRMRVNKHGREWHGLPSVLDAPALDDLTDAQRMAVIEYARGRGYLSDDDAGDLLFFEFSRGEFAKAFIARLRVDS